MLLNTPSVQKYLSSKWTKKDVSQTKIHLNTSSFIHFDDKYFRPEGPSLVAMPQRVQGVVPAGDAGDALECL